MRLASFNLENLFDRAKALNLETWDQGKPTLDLFRKANVILNKTTYSAADKARILEYLDELGVLRKDDAGAFVLLRQNRGRLLKRPTNGPVQVVADGREDWVGWLELKVEAVDEVATQMTAQVVRDVDADVMGLVEVESRTAVLRFNDLLLPMVGTAPYAHAMVIDGNDERGIDVGIMTKRGFAIDLVRSHVDDTDDACQVFSRDCPEYEVTTPSGGRLLVLVNHLKSKGYGVAAASNLRRKRQAQRVRDIYDARRAAGAEFVAIVGDMNDTPASRPQTP
jgi:hypothetical protein